VMFHTDVGRELHSRLVVTGPNRLTLVNANTAAHSSKWPYDSNCCTHNFTVRDAAAEPMQSHDCCLSSSTHTVVGGEWRLPVPAAQMLLSVNQFPDETRIYASSSFLHLLLVKVMGSSCGDMAFLCTNQGGKWLCVHGLCTQVVSGCVMGIRSSQPYSCPSGWYSKTNTKYNIKYCAPCLMGSTSSGPGATKCFPCPAGSASEIGGKCKKCEGAYECITFRLT
jgi:hypothetical protein